MARHTGTCCHHARATRLAFLQPLVDFWSVHLEPGFRRAVFLAVKAHQLVDWLSPHSRMFPRRATTPRVTLLVLAKFRSN